MTGERVDWLSIRAVLWVLDEAPDVPAPLVSTLVGLARHADQEGRNAYPSQNVLAGYTRKTVRQVKKDLAALVEKGLIRVAADQGAAGHIRADRRPVVYDLACTPRGNEGNPTTRREVPRGTPRPVVRDRTGGTPGLHEGNPSSPEEDRRSPEQPSPRGPVHDVVAKACPDAHEEEIETLVEQVNREAKTSPAGYANALASRGDLAARLERGRAANAEQQSGSLADAIERARRDPRQRCEHGTDGGLLLRPDTGKSATCPFCRRISTRAEVIASA